jgi:hypothetical protein
MAGSTPDPSPTCAPKILQSSPPAISLLALAAGPTHCALPDGPTISPSIPVPVPASPLAVRARAKAPGTSATSGPSGRALSPSAVLQLSLENKLRARLDVNGSPEYALKWKHWPMRSGPRICALRASARRTSDNAFTGWRTPTVGDSIRGVEKNPKLRNAKAGTASLNNEAALAGWPTPNVPNGGRSIAHAEMKGGTCYHQGKLVSIRHHPLRRRKSAAR